MSGKPLIPLAILLSWTFFSQAQPSKVSGNLRSGDRGDIANAAVILRKNQDSTLVRGTLSDEKGFFALENIAAGTYLLNVSHIGFTPYWQQVVVQNKDVTCKDIVLEKAAGTQLNTVVVKAKKPWLTRSVDKLTVNVDGTVYEKGEDALRLFNVIPGVQVTGQNILFRGSESITVYVDNRKIMLSGEQLFTYLRSIPSESIQSYELKTVPGAESDAQNGGVIINIVLKSEYKYGLSGSVTGGYWYNGWNPVSASTSINYRSGPLTLQAGGNYRRAPAFYNNEITQVYEPSGVYSPQTENYLEQYNSVGYNAGIDYRLTNKQTIGANYNGFANPGDISNTTTTNMRFFADRYADVIDSSTYSNKSTRYRYTNQMANVFYRNKLDSLGSRLDIGYSHVYYDLNEPSALQTEYLNSQKLEFRPRDSLFTNTSGNSNLNVVNIDLEKYFSKSTILDAGAKYTASKSNYSMQTRDGLTDQAPLDKSQSNQFLYNEYISAIYGAITRTYKSWDIKLGLRAEQTNYNGRSVTTGQPIGRNEWDLFPSAFINRKIGKIHSLTLSYGRRIDRPGFRDLNPFISYTSLNSIQEGNPNLLPYYSNNVQLEYMLKNKYTLTMGYQNTEKGIASSVTNVGDVIISQDENISNDHNVFLSLYIPVTLEKWWELDVDATGRYTTINVLTTPAVNETRFSQNIGASSKFNLPGKYYIEVFAFYNRNSFNGIYDAYNTGKLDVTLKKGFFNDRLTAFIDAEDPFHLYQPGYAINTGTFTRSIVTSRLDWARYIGVWLTYSFSGGKKESNRENIEAGGNEVRGRL